MENVIETVSSTNVFVGNPDGFVSCIMVPSHKRKYFPPITIGGRIKGKKKIKEKIEGLNAIERARKNATPLSLLKVEDSEVYGVLKNAGYKNRLRWNIYGDWVDDQSTSYDFFVYRLKSDFKPEEK